MTNKIPLILFALFWITISPYLGFSQQSPTISILTIGTYESESCGFINSSEAIGFIHEYDDKQYPQQAIAENSTLAIAYELEKCGLIDLSDGNIGDLSLPEDSMSVQIRKRIGADNIGTGFIYEYKGKKYVITCEHVILKAGKIKGYDATFRAYELRLVGGDTFYDIAVLEFVNSEETAKFKGVELETQLPRQGSLVQSRGYWYNNQLHPFLGKVSRNNHTIKNGTKDNIPKLGFIESTAKLPKGYSGGILMSEESKVLGMNVMRYSRKESYYALQSRIIKRIVKDIVDYGSARRAFTGIQFAQRTYIGTVGINKIISNSPAAKHRDQLKNQPVKSINGKPVSDIYDVLQIMEKIYPCDDITLKVGVEGHYRQFTITPELLERERLRQIAEHAVKYNNDVHIKGEVVIIGNKNQEIATTAGFDKKPIYCINSVEHLGALVRIFGLHQRIKIGADNDFKNSSKEISFSKENKMILYY